MMTEVRSDSEPLQEMMSLDPVDWSAFRACCEQQISALIDNLSSVSNEPVWKPVPQQVKAALHCDLPLEGQGSQRVCDEIRENILPWTLGNRHPRFFGWVHGTGTAGGMLAEMFAGAINANLGGREHAPVYVERTVINWCKQIFEFPETATGILVSGTSMATMSALAIARNHHAPQLREDGLSNMSAKMVGYTSSESHCSVAKAFEFLGLGRQQLRMIPANDKFEIDLEALSEQIQIDRRNGYVPFCVIGTAGTVNCAAIDDLDGLADICEQEQLWLHVDGAFGALAILSPNEQHLLKGIERADSLAFDFHKWLHVPYDAGCLLVRDGSAHGEAFQTRADYLVEGRGAAGGAPWFCDMGPELSRGFRALKVWFTIKEHGLHRLGQKIADNCQQARYLAQLVDSHDDLELLAPVKLNIVCFRYVAPQLSSAELNQLNAEIVYALHESGVAVPSLTQINGQTAIRVNITNHRTQLKDLELLLQGIEQVAPQVLQQFESPKIFLEDHEPASEIVKLMLERVLSRTELKPLLSGVTIDVIDDLRLPFQVDANHILLGRSAFRNEALLAVTIRHALELTILRKSDLQPSLHDECLIALMAQATAARYRVAQFPNETLCDSGINYEIINSPTAELCEHLLPLQGVPAETWRDVSGQEWQFISNRFEAFQSCVGPTEYLLTTGGDERLRIDSHTGLSKYGCRRNPLKGLAAYGSSTASSITSGNLNACEQVRERLVWGVLLGEVKETSQDIAEHVKHSVREVCGASQDVEVLLCSSGTDSELFATSLLAAICSGTLTNIVLAPRETGSGTPLAAAGCHYSDSTGLGVSVEQGTSFTASKVIATTVSVRDTNGVMRDWAEIHNEIRANVAQATQAGTCVMHILDASKTGWHGPGLDFINELKQDFGERLQVVVDACQMRGDSTKLNKYLQAGFLLQVSGSKAFGGPPFSGALLIPAELSQQLRQLETCPTGTENYAAQVDWPRDWPIAQQLHKSVFNSGLLLRWTAALREMRRFANVPLITRQQVLNQLGQTIQRALRETDGVVGVAAFDLSHAEQISDSSQVEWSEIPTIFPFRLKHLDPAYSNALLCERELKTIHRLLNLDLSFLDEEHQHPELAELFHIGQPVQLSDSAETSVLRVCTGASVVSRVVFDSEQGSSISQRLISEKQRLKRLFRKIHFVLANWERIQSMLEHEFPSSLRPHPSPLPNSEDIDHLIAFAEGQKPTFPATH